MIMKEIYASLGVDPDSKKKSVTPKPQNLPETLDHNPSHYAAGASYPSQPPMSRPSYPSQPPMTDVGYPSQPPMTGASYPSQPLAVDVGYTSQAPMSKHGQSGTGYTPMTGVINPSQAPAIPGQVGPPTGPPPKFGFVPSGPPPKTGFLPRH